MTELTKEMGLKSRDELIAEIAKDIFTDKIQVPCFVNLPKTKNEIKTNLDSKAIYFSLDQPDMDIWCEISEHTPHHTTPGTRGAGHPIQLHSHQVAPKEMPQTGLHSLEIRPLVRPNQ